MLGFSLSKLIVLAAVIAAVWYGFKFIGRLDAARKAQGSATTTRGRRAKPPRATTIDAEDMVRCPTCGTFVAPTAAGGCERPDCPYTT